MIVLASPRKPEVLEFGSTRFHFYVADADVVLFSIYRPNPDSVTGESNTRENAKLLVAEYVFAVDDLGDPDVVDDDGNPQPAEWPAKGAVPRFIATDEETPVDLAQIAERAAILARLPWNVLRALEKRIARTYTEAIGAGKA